jgi:hypothetical protein
MNKWIGTTALLTTAALVLTATVGKIPGQP